MSTTTLLYACIFAAIDSLATEWRVQFLEADCVFVAVTIYIQKCMHGGLFTQRQFPVITTTLRYPEQCGANPFVDPGAHAQ
jgi:hypothetical protein